MVCIEWREGMFASGKDGVAMLKVSDLHQYQKNIANHILKNNASFVLAECGLGKTVSTLSALSRIKGRVLILAPLRVAHTSWPDEIAKWEHTKNLSHKIIHGRREAYKFESNAKLHITNFESIPMIMEFVKGKKQLPWQTLIIDESSKVKSHSTKRFKALKKLRKGFSKIVLLTGTPCPNNLWELWSQVFILDGGERLDTAFTRFKAEYFHLPNPYQKYNWQPKEGTAQRLKEKITDITISLKAKDYLELPPVIYNDIPIELPEESRTIYDELEKEFFIKLDDTVVTAQNAAVLSSKLRQILQGGLYGEESTTILNKVKVDVLKEMVEDTDQNILCAYQFKFEMDLIQDNIKEAVFLTGAVKEDKNIIDLWNKGLIKCLCVHPASAGHGLNLQSGGHTVVWLGITWSLEQYLQLNARLYRQGQKNKVIIHHIVVRNTVDERVAKVLRNKNITQEDMINSLKEAQDATMQDLR